MMVVIIAFLFFLVLICLSDNTYVFAPIVLAALIYLLWILFDTYYLISGHQLCYKSALLKGSIEISSIVEIKKNKTMFAGLRPATAAKGLIITYNKWDDIYVSPIDADAFIEVLKNTNPSIKITGN